MVLAVLVAAGLYLFIPEQFRVSEADPLRLPDVPARARRDARRRRSGSNRPGEPVAADHDGRDDRHDHRRHGRLRRPARRRHPARARSSAMRRSCCTIGAVVWVTTVISFALWYWHLDCGGPAARANGTYGERGILPAFRFPEQGPRRARLRRLVPAVRRLPRPVVQHGQRVQPDRRVGRAALVEAVAHHGVGHLARADRPGRRPCRERPLTGSSKEAGWSIEQPS